MLRSNKKHPTVTIISPWGGSREIDINLQYVIQELWKNNFLTCSCCQGGPEDGHINFGENLKYTDKCIDILKNFNIKSTLYINTDDEVAGTFVLYFKPLTYVATRSTTTQNKNSN